MKGNPAGLGGSLTSKPTWSNTYGCSTTSAFFVLGDMTGETTRGILVQAFATGTIMEVFLLARCVPVGNWSGNGLSVA